MAGLATQGFALSDLPATPVIPSNVGKFSTKEANDTAESSLTLGQNLLREVARYKADQAALANQKAQSDAQASTAAPVAGAQIAQANRTSALASPDVVAAEKGKALTGLDADLIQEQNRRDTERFKNGLPALQRLALAQKGVPTATTGEVKRNPDGTTSVNQDVTAALGGEVAPISASTETQPTAPVITPIAGGPNGTNLGAVVSSVGPGGKGSTEVVHSPLSALNNITASSQRVVVGERVDENGNKKEIVQNMVQGAAGGAPHPVGAPFEIIAGSDPSVIRANGAGPVTQQPFISKDASKAIEDAQAEVQILQQRKLELSNIRDAADQFIGSGVGPGKFLGPIRAALGDAKAQEFTGSVQNALQTALQPLRGTGRVSQTEFNQALSALPTVNDQAETIRAKLNYLDFVTDWAQARQQAYLDNLGKGLNRYQAFQHAQKDTPLPPLPNFATGANTAYAAPAAGAHDSSAPSAAQAAPSTNSPPTITSQQQYDALPPGAPYLDAQGNPHVKGGKSG